MYATYNTLYHDPCRQTTTTAHTDRSRFACGSLPIQSQVRKSIDDAQYFPLDADCAHDCPEDDRSPDCRYVCAKKMTPVLSEPTINPTSKPTINPTTKPTSKPRENFSLEPRQSGITNQDQTKLLPVMNPEFNLREICKQCILLEDHLSHNEKRCFDCCVKHFLTIEALAEEALTLGPCPAKVKDLPTRVRHLQSQWHQDPDNNAPAVSQELRKIRKDFQLDAFDVVFRSSGSCQDGVCRLTPRQTG